MAVLLRWKTPRNEDVTYDYVYIYRSDSKNGTYSEIAHQSISDDTYFDANGNTSNWYKIRFYDSVNNVWSDYSDALQGGKNYFYCNIDDIRLISNYTSNEVPDSILYDLIAIAARELNHDIGVKVIREYVSYIDDTRKNVIDGYNKEFYVRNCKDYYLGDLNDDGVVDTDDVIVYLVDSNGTETIATVSSIDADNGKITLETAPPPSTKMYITYMYSPISMSTPSPLLSNALIYLTAALAATRLDAKRIKTYGIGKLRVSKTMASADYFFGRYKQILNLIKSHSFKRGEYRDILEEIKPGFKYGYKM